jgi:uncharacterized protein
MRRHVKLATASVPGADAAAGMASVSMHELPSLRGRCTDVTDLAALALAAAPQLPPAELHGVVCGLAVCFGDDLPLEELVELVGIDTLTDQRSVAAFVAVSIHALEADDMRFALLLPDDDVDVAARAEALGQWCGSFLAGLSAGLAQRGWGSLDDSPGEVREIIEDLSAIARIDADAVIEERSDERVEADFLELREFVKVGVLLIMSVLRDDSDDPAE